MRANVESFIEQKSRVAQRFFYALLLKQIVYKGQLRTLHMVVSLPVFVVSHFSKWVFDICTNAPRTLQHDVYFVWTFFDLFLV